MHFKRGQPDESGKDVTKDLYIKPRSFMIFSGEVRYNWLHSISLRKVDKVNYESEGLGDDQLKTRLNFRHRRISLTFRRVKTDGPCQCKWPLLCDS
jgi:hypothetical protein